LNKRSLYNPLLPSFWNDPYPHYARLRETEPVYRSHLRLITISRYADAVEVLSDNARFLPSKAKAPAGRPAAPIYSIQERMMIFTTGAAHARLQEASVRLFSPAAMRPMQGFCEEVWTRLFSAARSSQSFDYISTVAMRMPVEIISKVVGVPPAFNEDVLRWSYALANTFDMLHLIDARTAAAANEALSQLSRVFRGLIAERRADPRPDLISAFIQQGELSEEDIIANSILLYFAGHETTSGALGNSLYTLLRYPEAREQLRRSPELIPNAVEELMRFEPPVHAVVRVAANDTTVAGHRIEGGEEILVLQGSANRDPEAFPQPDMLQLDRKGKRPLLFGYGMHACLGASLAKLELGVALRALVELKSLKLADTGNPTWRTGLILRRLSALPIVVE
jgi:cytochrome P450